MVKKLQGHPRFFTLLEEMADIHSRKNSNYATDKDPLSNLRELQDVARPALGVLFRMSDKWSRLKELMKGKPDMVNESIYDTLIDLANYSLLLCIILEEETKK